MASNASHSTKGSSIVTNLCIPSSAIDFNALQVDKNRRKGFYDAVETHKGNCPGCFPAYSVLHYSAVSKIAYINKVPADKLVNDSIELYNKLKSGREECLERHRLKEACIDCQRRSLKRSSEHLKRYNGNNWRPPLKFASTFGFFINEVILVWENCKYGCLQRYSLHETTITE